MMNRKKRLLSSLLCVIFVAALIVSGALIATRLQHECLGESCPVCAAISGWERLLRGMARWQLFLKMYERPNPMIMPESI